MSFWTKLFGAENLINKVADGVTDGVDAAFFTPEERAKHYLEVLRNIEPFKVAQRWFAMFVITPYVIVWLMCAVLFVVSVFFTGDKADQIMEVSDLLAQRNNDVLGIPVAIIVSFYFGGGALEGIVGKFKK